MGTYIDKIGENAIYFCGEEVETVLKNIWRDNMDTNSSQAPTAGVAYQASTAPVGQIKTNRSLLKYILLGIITLGIYPIIVLSSISSDINAVACRYDGKRTMHYCLLFFLVGPITLGIAYLVWYHHLSNRIGTELKRRGISYEFGAIDYWLWGVLGSLIVVGPFF